MRKRSVEMSDSKLANINQYIGDIINCVKSFSLESMGYKSFTPIEAGVKGDNSNIIYVKEGVIPKNLSLLFDDKAKNCKIFIGENLMGAGSKISIKNENCVVFIGDNTTLNKVMIALLSKGDFIIVGEGVSVTSTNTWISGYNPGKEINGLVIGDHCLMASNITIRASDGHQIIDLESRQQVNISHSPIFIEPYCWIGQNAAILKNVRMGACSIVSFGAVVTKSCERFSALSGVPATSKSIQGKMWLRNKGADAKRIQEYYEKKYLTSLDTKKEETGK